MKLVIKRDGATRWDIDGDTSVGTLSARDEVTASGPLTTPRNDGKRFDPKDDELCSRDEMTRKYSKKSTREIDQYWTNSCRPRQIIPIRGGGAVEWDHVRVSDARSNWALSLKYRGYGRRWLLRNHERIIVFGFALAVVAAFAIAWCSGAARKTLGLL